MKCEKCRNDDELRLCYCTTPYLAYLPQLTDCDVDNYYLYCEACKHKIYVTTEVIVKNEYLNEESFEEQRKQGYERAKTAMENMIKEVYHESGSDSGEEAVPGTPDTSALAE